MVHVAAALCELQNRGQGIPAVAPAALPDEASYVVQKSGPGSFAAIGASFVSVPVEWLSENYSEPEVGS